MVNMQEADIYRVPLTLLLFIPICRHVKEREMMANSKTFAFQCVMGYCMYSVIHNFECISSYHRIFDVIFVCVCSNKSPARAINSITETRHVHSWMTLQIKNFTPKTWY
jgi:hypothetical protein